MLSCPVQEAEGEWRSMSTGEEEEKDNDEAIAVVNLEMVLLLERSIDTG